MRTIPPTTDIHTGEYSCKNRCVGCRAAAAAAAASFPWELVTVVAVIKDGLVMDGGSWEFGCHTELLQILEDLSPNYGISISGEGIGPNFV